MQGDSYSFDITESEYDNQIVLSYTIVKEKRLKSKSYIGMRKTPHCFKLQYAVRILDNVSTYGTLTEEIRH